MEHYEIKLNPFLREAVRKVCSGPATKALLRFELSGHIFFSETFCRA